MRLRHHLRISVRHASPPNTAAHQSLNIIISCFDVSLTEEIQEISSISDHRLDLFLDSKGLTRPSDRRKVMKALASSHDYQGDLRQTLWGVEKTKTVSQAGVKACDALKAVQLLQSLGPVLRESCPMGNLIYTLLA